MINQTEIINKTISFVKDKLSHDTTGHDWWHTERVYKLAKHIGEKEKADIFIVKLSALLHDIADWKFNDGDENIGPRIAEKFLKQLNLDTNSIDQIKEIIRSVSFKGANVKKESLSLEGKVVQDADRIEALGAIGIARAFAYGGYKGNKIYDPGIKPLIHNNFEEYKNHRGTSVNHFYEKLLLLKDEMNTATGKRIAEKRHKFIEDYLSMFLSEWNLDFLD